MTMTKSYGLAALAMLAFAGNSLLNRFALIDGEAGAWSFTLIRLISGALILMILSRFKWKHGSWAGGLTLLHYAGGFSYAYLYLDAGLGALILFAMVQFTMLSAGIFAGERLGVFQGIGAMIAFFALFGLLWPSGSEFRAAPTLMLSYLAMSAAGVGWGLYSLLGRTAQDPLVTTAGNFCRASLIAVFLAVPIFYAFPEAIPSKNSVGAAIISGALTSGVGYAIWYAALPKLTRLNAGIMQLSVPAIATIGGVLFLGEYLTLQSVVSTGLVLMGVGMATLSKPKHA